MSIQQNCYSALITLRDFIHTCETQLQKNQEVIALAWEVARGLHSLNFKKVIHKSEKETTVIAGSIHALKGLIGNLAGHVYVFSNGQQEPNSLNIFKQKCVNTLKQALQRIEWLKDSSAFFVLNYTWFDLVEELDCKLSSLPRDWNLRWDIIGAAKLQIQADKYYLIEEGFGELFHNSHKAVEKGKPLRIEITIETDERYAKWAKIVCLDNGHGIPEEVKPFLFDRSISYWPNYEKGTGVGLAHARNIADAHGGKLWASRRCSKGAEFVIQIPRRRSKHVVSNSDC